MAQEEPTVIYTDLFQHGSCWVIQGWNYKMITLAVSK